MGFWGLENGPPIGKKCQPWLTKMGGENRTDQAAHMGNSHDTAEPRYVETADEVAARAGVHRRTVMEWLSAGAPPATDAGYDVEAILAWRQVTRRGGGPTDDTDLTEWKVRRLIAEARDAEAKARLREFDADKTTEDVVHLDQVEQFLAGLFTEFRRQLARVPKQMAPSFPEEYRQQIQDELADQLDLIGKSMQGYCLRVTELRD